MDWSEVFWEWQPALAGAVLIVLSAEYRAWRDRRNLRGLHARLDRIAAALEREL